MDSYSVTLAIAVIITTLALCTTWLRKKKKHHDSHGRKEPPELPGCWPIIGHLHLLMRATTPAHRVLTALAENYGPAFKFHFGKNSTLVISSWDLAKECLTTNDAAFAGRPPMLSPKIMGYGPANLTFAPYGHYWREIRKIAMLKLLSTRKLEELKHIRDLEVETWMRDLFCLWQENRRNPVRVDMNNLLEELTFNVIMQTVAGKRYYGIHVPEADREVAHRYRSLLKQVLNLSLASGLYDALPFLQWMDFQGHIRAMKKVGMEMDLILQSWVDEHRRKTETEGGQDFIDVLLSNVEEGDLTVTYSTDTIVKATVMNIIAGSVETTSSTMCWALALLLKKRHSLKKLQAELDEHVGHDRMVNESDITDFTYLQSVVKETLRLYPSGALLPPHLAREDCKVGGFWVKRGTHLIVNSWKIHRDPNLWSSPEEFCPERFLNSDGTMNQEKFIPFGMGRRSCPGMMFAQLNMHLILARLLHSFELELPPDFDLDFEDGFNFSLFKLNHVQVLASPRLPLELYE